MSKIITLPLGLPPSDVAVGTLTLISGRDYQVTNINTTINNILLGTGGNKATITYSTNTARTLTIPDVGGNRTFSFINQDESISGTKTFSATNTTFQNIVFGTQTNKSTLSYTTNTARTLTIPDVGGNRTFSFINENETISGTKTFSNGLILQNSSLTTNGSLRFNGTNFEGIRNSGIWETFLTSGNVVTTNTTQTIIGVKTFTTITNIREINEVGTNNLDIKTKNNLTGSSRDINIKTGVSYDDSGSIFIETGESEFQSGNIICVIGNCNDTSPIFGEFFINKTPLLTASNRLFTVNENGIFGNSTTTNAFSNTTTLNIGNTNVTTINMGNTTNTQTINFGIGGGTNNKTINIGTGRTGGSTVINIGSSSASVSSRIDINNDIRLTGGNRQIISQSINNVGGDIKIESAGGQTSGGNITLQSGGALGTEGSIYINAGTSQTGASLGGSIYINAGTASGNGGSIELSYGTGSSNGNFVIKRTTTNVLNITGSNNFVGINQTSPSERLDVGGNIKGITFYTLAGTVTTSTTQTIFIIGNGQTYMVFINSNSGYAQQFYLVSKLSDGTNNVVQITTVSQLVSVSISSSNVQVGWSGSTFASYNWSAIRMV